MIVVRAIVAAFVENMIKTIENINFKKEKCGGKVVISPSLLTQQHHV